jgi:hypothetical protein
MLTGAFQGTHQSTIHQVTSAKEAAILRQPHEINLRTDNVITGPRRVIVPGAGRAAPVEAAWPARFVAHAAVWHLGVERLWCFGDMGGVQLL